MSHLPDPSEPEANDTPDPEALPEEAPSEWEIVTDA
jgi:hypothetical protein